MCGVNAFARMGVLRARSDVQIVCMSGAGAECSVCGRSVLKGSAAAHHKGHVQHVSP